MISRLKKTGEYFVFFEHVANCTRERVKKELGVTKKNMKSYQRDMD